MSNPLYEIPPSDFQMLNAMMLMEKRLGSGATLNQENDAVDFFKILQNLTWLYPQTKNQSLIRLYDKIVTTLREVPDGGKLESMYAQYQSCLVTEYYDIDPMHAAASIRRNKEKTRLAKLNLDVMAAEQQIPRKAMLQLEVLIETTVKNILKEPELSLNSHHLLLHLLICLSQSNPNHREMAAKMAAFSVNSIELPNDTFLNHLLYVTLISMIDPTGIYRLNNPSIVIKLNELKSYIIRDDNLAHTLKDCIDYYLAMLHADPSYPMHDGNNPAFGFNTRMTDTLEALDAARKKLSN